MADKTPAPNGLSISRNGKKFTFSWKVKADNHNDGQHFEWKNGIKKKKEKSESWKSVTVTNSARSLNRSISLKKYYPYNEKRFLKSIKFRVQGKQKKNGKKKTLPWSNWSDTKSFDLEKPNAPSISCGLTSSGVDNSSTVSWSTTTSTTDKKIFSNILLETILVTDSNNHGSEIKKGWSKVSDTYKASGSYVKEEATSGDNGIYLSNNKSRTRWYRARSRGPRGASEWKYAYIVYAYPNKPTIKSATASKDSVATNTIECYVKWDSDVKEYSRPVDSETVQYCLTSPNTGFTLPDGATWTDGPTIRDSALGKKTIGRNTNSSSFIIDAPLLENQCLFVRVVSSHNSKDTPSDFNLINTLPYSLTTPSITSVDPDPSTYRISLIASNTAYSSVPDSKLAVVYRGSTSDTDKVIAILSGETPSATVQCPNWSGESDYSIGIYSFATKVTVSYTEHTENGVTYRTYDIPSNLLMKSEEDWESGNVPKAPKIQLSSPNSETIQVTWTWAWNSANVSELSWSDHEDAWESTDEPSTYRVTNVHAAKWNISGLESGVEWFVRVRLIKSVDDSEIIGPWSDIMSWKLTSAPDIPTLKSNKYILHKDDTFTVNWSYVSNDGTDQKSIEICPVTINNDGSYTYGTNILNLETTESEHVFDPVNDELGWVLGNSYYLSCRVQSQSERYSEWSKPIKISLVTPLTISISESSLEKRGETYFHTEDLELVTGKKYYTVSATVVDDPIVDEMGTYYEADNGIYYISDDDEPEDGTTYYTITATAVVSPDVSSIGSYYEAENGIYYLTELPLTITILGAGTDAFTSVVIKRDDNYHSSRPDESTFEGYLDETIAYIEPQKGEDEISIDIDDLVGSLDDTAKYRIEATVYDEYGQSVNTTLPFVIDWNIQAVKPDATVLIDDEQYIAKITPILPTGRSSELEDVCDIYRLSADRPELIVENGSFGTTYVDPYPAIGAFGGHRVVLKTANGDYITENGEYAWIDLDGDDGDIFNCVNSIIDSPDGRLEFLYNIDLSSSWQKDFTETKYLGGSVQGDWNPAISRTGTVNTVSVIAQDQETIKGFRRLADYAGICHIRTRDGSSYSADIQVSEDIKYDAYQLASYSLSITRVDSEELDGMTLAEWNENNS